MLIMMVMVIILMMKIWVDIAPVLDFVGTEKIVRLPNAVIPLVKTIAVSFRPFNPLFLYILYFYI